MGHKVTKETLDEATILDIRTRDEFCKGHVARAIHVETPLPPLSSAQRQRLARKLKALRLSKQHPPILVCCKKGIRAQVAKDILNSLGYKNVKNIGGKEKGAVKKVFESPDFSAYIRRC